MISNIFSSFDVFEFRYMYFIYPIFILIFPTILILSSSFYIWIPNNRNSSILIQPLNIIFSQLSRTYRLHIKRYTIIISSLFIILIFVNLIGIIPYSFRISTHLLFTLSLGLPLWLSIILSRIIYRKKQFIGKLLPDGAPDWLNPFLVLIETVRISVRPLTLSFRLGANIRAGHIVLSLLGNYLAIALTLSLTNTLILIIISIAYILFEFAICLIQAYIFCLLLSLYTDDHTSYTLAYMHSGFGPERGVKPLYFFFF